MESAQPHLVPACPAPERWQVLAQARGAQRAMRSGTPPRDLLPFSKQVSCASFMVASCGANRDGGDCRMSRSGPSPRRGAVDSLGERSPSLQESTPMTSASERIAQQCTFLVECDRLKDIVR